MTTIVERPFPVLRTTYEDIRMDVFSSIEETFEGFLEGDKVAIVIGIAGGLVSEGLLVGTVVKTEGRTDTDEAYVRLDFHPQDNPDSDAREP